MSTKSAHRLFLPAEISRFERLHLTKMNRIALFFFCGHLPLMVLVAALCGTSMAKAAAFTALVLAGPIAAYYTCSNPRTVARVFGFASMCLGGVLVHVGQGPMQIEMHFYFFVLIALLAVFADPMVIIVAAVTVATHHVVLYLAVPSSVFNYEASLWAVVVHALFVVLESIAACFVARRFFDNVIGLERTVEMRTSALAARTDEMRLVMDNVAAGLVTVGADGVMSAEHSSALERWLGPPVAGEAFWSYVGRADENAAVWIEMVWEMLVDAAIPDAVALEQCPQRIIAGERTLALTVSAVPGATRRFLVVMTDITIDLERERREAEQRETVALCERAIRDPHGFAEYIRETTSIMAAIADGAEDRELLRLIHTAKGNSAIFGATTLADLCHEVEGRISEESAMAPADRAAIAACWARISSGMAALRGEDRGRLHIERAEHAAVVGRLRAGGSGHAVADTIDSWRFERAEDRLQRIAEQAQSIAERLDRAPLEIVTESGLARFPDEDWSGFWTAFIHLVRNAIDHGIESPEERLAKGKPEAGRLILRTQYEGDHVVVELEDDGRGIDWERVASRARALHLPTASEADLVEALFADGLSTRSEATELSGRGVGMSAVREACAQLGATLTVTASAGSGTKFRVALPIAARQAA